MEERQASAASAAPSRNEFDAATLCFSSHQDALDFARHSAEHSNWMLASNNLIDIVERYRKGELEIVLDICSRSSAKKYNLIFIAIPSGGIVITEPP